jgi:hypothetical protein
MNASSHRAKLIRATVASVLNVHAPFPERAQSTTVLTELSLDQLARLVGEIGLVERHEIRVALDTLVRAGQCHRQASGEREPARGRYRGGIMRAVRGTVTWSLPRQTAMTNIELGREAVSLTSIADASGEPLWQWLPGMVDTFGRRVLQVCEASHLLMADENGHEHWAYVVQDHDPPKPLDDVIPDFDDEPTRWALFGLMRKAWGHGPDRDVRLERIASGYALAVRVWDVERGAWVYDARVHGGWMGGEVSRPNGCVGSMDRATEVDAMVAGLRAAPTRAGNATAALG